MYDIIGKKTSSKKVADFVIAASAAEKLRGVKIGHMGYRDMNLYGTMFDGPSLKRVVGTEIETFEMLGIYQRYQHVADEEKQAVIDSAISKWKFLKEAKPEGLKMAADYYLALESLIDERGYEAVSLKDVDGMKKL